MRIISWNVNGLADPKKAKQVMRRLLSFNADVIILQEIFKHNTKRQSSNIAKKIENIQSLARYYWKTDMYFDPSGRIAILSHYNNSLHITNTYSEGRIVDFTFTHVARGDRRLQIPYFTSNFRAIYAPAESGTRKSLFWTRFPPLPPLSWVVGDFNLVLHKNRSAKTTSDNPGMVNDLLEHHLDTHFLLSNRHPKPTYHHPSTTTQRSSRIDYIFAPDTQLKPASKFRLEGPGLLSDHSILVLDNLDTERNTAPSWRMNIRTLHNSKVNEDIGKLIMNIQAAYEWDDFKYEVQTLCKDFGKKQENKKKDSIMNLTNRLHKLRQRSLTPAIAKDIESVSTKLSKLEQDLAERLAIKSGAQWLEEGERSSSYFFSRFKQRLQFAKIPDLNINGQSITEAKAKALACKYHLQNQWERRDVQQANNFPWHCPKLSPTQSNSIARPITQEEVVDAITHSPNGKAPGPDGIPSEFYKHFKDTLATPMTRMFNDILLIGGCTPVSWYQSKCILIPKKKAGLDNLANWRPITLENCDLKIFSRILANRTQNILNTLIGNEQTGFIAGRRIHHSALIIDTVLHSRSKGSYLLSLDWSKAYDKVNHRWLSYCLRTFGFPQDFIRTIEDLFYRRTAAVAVDNNEEFIQCRQGVPQGDPIAPLLFVLALEPLLAAARVEIAGVETPKGTLTNAAFADDSTFFLKDDRNVTKLIALLQQYSDVSGAVVNWGKSALTPLSNHPPIQTTPFTITSINQPPPP